MANFDWDKYEEKTSPKSSFNWNDYEEKKTSEPDESAFQKILRYGVKDPIAGIAQVGNSILNIPHKLDSAIPAHEENFDYSRALGVPDKNIADSIIQFLPDLAGSFAVPETKLGSVGRAIEKIPQAGKYLKTALGNALSQGGYAAAMTSGDPGNSALEAGSIAGPFAALSQAALSGSPVLKAISKGTLGAGAGLLGYHGAKSLGAGDTTSDLVGALVGLTGARGLSGEKAALDGVLGTNYKDALDAGKRLGLSYVSPAEASNNPFTGAFQGRAGKTEEGAKIMYNNATEREKSEKDSINNLLDTISPDTSIKSADIRDAANAHLDNLKKQRLDASEPFYTKAHTKKVAPTWVTNLENSDPTIKNAISDAMSDPKYQVEGELKGLPKNSIKVLDYAKRKIDSQISGAKKAGDNDSARVLTNSKNTLIDKISLVDDDYQKARDTYSELSKPIEEFKNSQIGNIAKIKNPQLKKIPSMIFDSAQTDPSVLSNIKDIVQKTNPEAWNGIVRNQMQNLMKGAKKVNGSTFNNKVLSDDNRFNQLKLAVSHNPDASQKLDDMKLLFPRLIGTDTAKSAADLAKLSMSKDRNDSSPGIRMLKELLSGGNYDKKATSLITNKDWEKRLHDLIFEQHLKDRKNAKIYNVLGKAGSQIIGQ